MKSLCPSPKKTNKQKTTERERERKRERGRDRQTETEEPHETKTNLQQREPFSFKLIQRTRHSAHNPDTKRGRRFTPEWGFSPETSVFQWTDWPHCFSALLFTLKTLLLVWSRYAGHLNIFVSGNKKCSISTLRLFWSLCPINPLSVLLSLSRQCTDKVNEKDWQRKWTECQTYNTIAWTRWSHSNVSVTVQCQASNTSLPSTTIHYCTTPTTGQRHN